MAGAPRVRSLNIAAPEADARPVLVPGGNKTPAAARKPSPKPLQKAPEATPDCNQYLTTKKDAAAATAGSDGGARKGGSPPPLPSPRRTPPRKPHDSPAVVLNASFSLEASRESLHGQASGGRTERIWSRAAAPKHGKAACKVMEKHAGVAEAVALVTPEAVQGKRRCAWVTPTTDPHCVTFHDEEWGFQRLFELLVLSGALAELSWPEILKKRQFFREIFMNFDLIAVSNINEKKLVAPGRIARSILSEQKLIFSNKLPMQIVDKFGSFSQYCWGFLNPKPVVSKIQYPRQVPVKSPRADMMSKDMVRRGLRGVGPTVIYSFMQAAGLMSEYWATGRLTGVPEPFETLGRLRPVRLQNGAPPSGGRLA
ncbi:hypothetical protein VPH35_132449 [Triticum aestivum]